MVHPFQRYDDGFSGFVPLQLDSIFLDVQELVLEECYLTQGVTASKVGVSLLKVPLQTLPHGIILLVIKLHNQVVRRRSIIFQALDLSLEVQSNLVCHLQLSLDRLIHLLHQ